MTSREFWCPLLACPVTKHFICGPDTLTRAPEESWHYLWKGLPFHSVARSIWPEDPNLATYSHLSVLFLLHSESLKIQIFVGCSSPLSVKEKEYLRDFQNGYTSSNGRHESVTMMLFPKGDKGEEWLCSPSSALAMGGERETFELDMYRTLARPYNREMLRLDTEKRNQVFLNVTPCASHGGTSRRLHLLKRRSKLEWVQAKHCLEDSDVLLTPYGKWLVAWGSERAKQCNQESWLLFCREALAEAHRRPGFRQASRPFWDLRIGIDAHFELDLGVLFASSFAVPLRVVLEFDRL